LRESHRQQLVQTRRSPETRIASVAAHAFLKFIRRQIVQQLSEHRAAEIHPPFCGDAITITEALSLDRTSNRKIPLTYCCRAAYLLQEYFLAGQQWYCRLMLRWSRSQPRLQGSRPEPGPRRRDWALAGAALAILGASFFCPLPLAAQWFKYPSAGVPRKSDHSVNVSAPAPRLPDGKPDFSGIWATGEPIPQGGPLATLKELASSARTPATPSDRPVDAAHIGVSRQAVDIGVDISGGLPYQPWLARVVKERIDNQAKDDPHIKCLPDNFLRAYGLPHLLKFVHKPGLLVVLNEMNAGYRQVFTDGRPPPVDPAPSWQGYSSAKWSGDTLMIDTIGLRDDTWIDWIGSVLTEQAKVREEMSRPDFGHLVIKVTVNDPKAYTKPWTVTLRQNIVVDTELVDEICLEGEESLKHLK
jgi:hypothetical protein